ncbi:hypothetical protein J4217_00600 [Candidatus Pacearchaeota archaeon]|nr:hypothetical protein [Candidatus Pacearchaeota archaeon]
MVILRGILKKLAITGVLGLSALLFEGCATTRDKQEVMLPDSFRPIKFAEKLEINTNNIYRLIVKKSEVDGIKDLRKLMETSYNEEQYAYFGTLGLWIEIGENESLVFDFRLYNRGVPYFQNHVSEDSDYLKCLARLDKKITLFHIHPSGERAFLKHLAETAVKIGNNEEQIRKMVDSMKILSRLSFMQSDSDVRHDIKGLQNLYRIHPDGEFKACIISFSGIGEFYFSDEGKKYVGSYNEANLDSRVYQALRTKNTLVDNLYGTKLPRKMHFGNKYTRFNYISWDYFDKN